MKKWILSLKLIVLTFALAVTSCGKQPDGMPNIPSVKGPIFNIADGKVVVTLNLLTVNFDIGGKIAIPETFKSSVEVMPNIVDGGISIQLNLDPEDIKGVNVGDDPTTLPDGRALPGIPGGTLPGLRADTHIGKVNLSFYFSKTLFGFFVPFKLNTAGLAAYYQFKLHGQPAGLIGVVSSNEEKQSGLVIFLKLDALKNPTLQNLIQKSERNPGLVF